MKIHTKCVKQLKNHEGNILTRLTKNPQTKYTRLSLINYKYVLQEIKGTSSRFHIRYTVNLRIVP